MKLLERLKYWSEAQGDKVALVDREGTRCTTYRELDVLSDKVAERLLREGVKPGSAVMVRMPRCMEYIAEEIGILKAGCAYVPLLPEYPDDRVEYIRNDCREIPADTAMVIYTSGSTGRPKGVVYSVKAFEAAIERMTPLISDLNKIVVASLVPFPFVATLLDLLVPLSCGGAVHIISDETSRNIVKLQDYFAAHSITTAHIISRIVKSYKNKDKSLIRLTTGSERLSGFYSDEFEVINIYGQSEGMGISSFHVDRTYDNTPIGKPFSGILLKVLDDNGNEVPQGQEGEICAIGILPSQYLHLPEQTAQTFEILSDGRTLLHTKDIGRILPDGNLLYVNRKDWMVKINGQRVEPGEVEAAMMHALPVTKTVVKDFTTRAGQVFLAGFYTAEKKLSDNYIKKQLSKVLPDYMIPTRFVHVEKFPTTVTGKVNRKELTLPDLDNNGYLEPETDMERTLCQAFQLVLKSDRIGATDDFFNLGGDSINVLHLQNKMDIVGLSTQLIYKGRTPRGIATLLEGHTAEDLFGKAMTVERNIYPMTSSQLAIYYQCHYNPEGTMYNNPFIIRLDDSIDAERLKAAWQHVLANHSVFRAQVVKDDSGRPGFRMTADGQASEYCKWEIKDGAMSFDIHHLIFDGTSMGILLRELSRAYDGEALEHEQVNPLKLGLVEEMRTTTPAYEQAHSVYRDMFEGKDCDTSLPYDMPETEEDDIPCREFTLTLDGDKQKAVDALVSEKKITANTLFLWAYCRTLSDAVGKNGVHFCTSYHGRTDARLHNAVGMIVKTLPLYVEIDRNADFDTQLKETERCLQTAIEASIYPYAKVEDEFALEYRNTFVYQGDEYTSLSLAGKRYPIEIVPVGSAITDLRVMVLKYADRYAIRFIYRSDCYREETIRAFAANYIDLLINVSG